jgi:polyisoprenoid-binding protein YceI
MTERSSGRLRIGPGNAHLFVRTRREGFAARVGHDLRIEVTRWSGEIDNPGDLATTRLTVRIELDSFAVREGTGGVKPLSASDRAEIDGNIRKVLASGKGDSATFTSTKINPDKDGGSVDGTLRLKGVERPVRLLVRGGEGKYRGTASLVQSQFGIKPYSTFLGALKLRDEVEIEFDVDLGKAEAVDAP